MKKLETVLDFVEVNFIIAVPIYLYGWLEGLLMASALTSLMHIVSILGDKKSASIT